MPRSLIGKHCNGNLCDIAGVILRTSPYSSVPLRTKRSEREKRNLTPAVRPDWMSG